MPLRSLELDGIAESLQRGRCRGPPKPTSRRRGRGEESLPDSVQLYTRGTLVSDDFTDDDAFAETQGIWWAGIAFASIATFAIIGGLLVSGTYVLNELGLAEIPYWLPAVTAVVLTIILVTVAVKRETIKYEPK